MGQINALSSKDSRVERIARGVGLRSTDKYSEKSRHTGLSGRTDEKVYAVACMPLHTVHTYVRVHACMSVRGTASRRKPFVQLMAPSPDTPLLYALLHYWKSRCCEGASGVCVQYRQSPQNPRVNLERHNLQYSISVFPSLFSCLFLVPPHLRVTQK